MATYSTHSIRKVFKWVMESTERGACHRHVPDGTESADITVTVDLPAIAERFGARAMANKSGTSKFMGGLVVVTATNRTRGV
jgi:hypothetical protein